MIEQIARYLIGALVGAAVALLIALPLADRWHGEQLRDWERAAERQRDAERARMAKHNEEVIHGWSSAVDWYRSRLAAGWRPAVPRDVPAAGVSATAGRADGRSSDAVPAAAGATDPAAGPPHVVDLTQCRADLDRLIADGAATTLQVRAWQSWALGLDRGPGDPAR